MPEIVRIENRLDGHDKDIKDVVRTVDKLVMLYEHSQAERKEDRDVIKNMANKIGAMSDKMTAMLGLEKDVAVCKEEIRVARHDIANMMAGAASTEILKEKIAALVTDVAILKRAKDQKDGATEALTKGASAFWAVFGGIITTAILALGFWVLHSYFNVSVERTPG